ncbi:MAG TPA: hypothetical protein P5048_02740 [Chlamydiales bacterium]|nr:hypothetical protein [Chlamydiales bacterium]
MENMIGRLCDSYKKIPGFIFPNNLLEADYQKIEDIRSVVFNFQKIMRESYEFLSRKVFGFRFIVTAIYEFMPIAGLGIGGLMAYSVDFFVAMTIHEFIFYSFGISILMKTFFAAMHSYRDLKLASDEFVLRYQCRNELLKKMKEESFECLLERETICPTLLGDKIFRKIRCHFTGLPIRFPVRSLIDGRLYEREVAEKIFQKILSKKNKRWTFLDCFQPAEDHQTVINENLHFYQKIMDRVFEEMNEMRREFLEE